jgi:uncharacterized membrane protein
LRFGLAYAAPNAASAADTPLISRVNRSCSFFNCSTMAVIFMSYIPLGALYQAISRFRSLRRGRTLRASSKELPTLPSVRYG